MKKRAFIIATILILWLVAMGWLVFVEAYPGLLDRAPAGYRTLLNRGVMIMDRWMTLSYLGHNIGYTHTSVDAGDEQGVRQYRIRNQTLLSLTIMGARQRISVTSDAAVDTQYTLQTFHFSLSSSGYSITVDGKRQKGRLFDVTLHSAGSTQRLSVSIPDDAVIYSPLTEMTLKALSPGRRVTLRVFNPVTLSSQDITVRALRREPLIQGNRTNETLVLAAKMDGMETLSWMDSSGVMLRQQTPFGWTLESSTAQDALSPANTTDTGDLLTALAVPITGNADLLTSQPTVRLRLTGVTLTREQLETHRQEIVSLGPHSAEIIVKADALPSSPPDDGPTPPDLAPWLASTAFIQAHDRRLVEKAADIVGDRTNRLEAALAIYEWVHTHVAKKPTVSLPSALDVLQRPEGDCNEHTYLFAGLARAAGIPTRIRVGVTLHEGRFYYHAWPSVYVGRWLDMDPTLGLPAVSAGYISLVEGELGEQMKLMGIIGQMKVDIQ